MFCSFHTTNVTCASDSGGHCIRRWKTIKSHYFRFKIKPNFTCSLSAISHVQHFFYTSVFSLHVAHPVHSPCTVHPTGTGRKLLIQQPVFLQIHGAVLRLLLVITCLTLEIFKLTKKERNDL